MELTVQSPFREARVRAKREQHRGSKTVREGSFSLRNERGKRGAAEGPCLLSALGTIKDSAAGTL